MTIFPNTKKTTFGLSEQHSLSTTERLTRKELDALSERYHVETLKKGETLFMKGDICSDKIYLLKGRVGLISKLTKGEKFISSVNGGSEEALIPLDHVIPRRLFAIARTNIKFIRIPEIEAPEHSRRSVKDPTIMAIKSLNKSVGAFQTAKASQKFTTKQYRKGEIIIHQNSQNNSFYIIADGECEFVYHSTSHSGEMISLKSIKTGETFGEESILLKLPHLTQVRARTLTTVLQLDGDDFRELIYLPTIARLSSNQLHEEHTVVDVREKSKDKEHATMEHLPDTISIPLRAIRFKTLKLPKNGKILTLCDDGSQSKVAAYLLHMNGFNCEYLNNGINAESF